MSVVFLTKEQIVNLHEECIKLYGGNYGELNINNIDSAIGSVESTHGGLYLNEFPFEMAASYFYSICQNHAFTDGNKRTAVVSAITFLEMNGFSPTFSDKDLYNISIKVANGSLKKKDIAVYLKNNTK